MVNVNGITITYDAVELKKKKGTCTLAFFILFKFEFTIIFLNYFPHLAGSCCNMIKPHAIEPAVMLQEGNPVVLIIWAVHTYKVNS